MIWFRIDHNILFAFASLVTVTVRNIILIKVVFLSNNSFNKLNVPPTENYNYNLTLKKIEKKKNRKCAC